MHVPTYTSLQQQQSIPKVTHHQPFACKRKVPWSCHSSWFRDAPERRASSGYPPQRPVGMRVVGKTFWSVLLMYSRKTEFYVVLGLLTWNKSLWLKVCLSDACLDAVQ
jgi:hypothetical protein